MELRLLVTFEKVATVLSFTQAAAELKYVQRHSLILPLPSAGRPQPGTTSAS
jgi:hypothetical protein